jgi:KUP system potassium uptake protein
MTKTKNSLTPLAIVALGIVFGDIGTSPLYALEAIFGKGGRNIKINQENVYGIISLVIWLITLAVTIKFVSFIMRADNQGEGGIMALVSLIKAKVTKHKWLFIFIGLIGVSLFYGDSLITPAISVLSAVQGLQVIAPKLSSLVIPITIAILCFLFFIQKYGTQSIGRFFGPVMFVWFSSIALGGLYRIIEHPGVLIALSPITAISFIIHHVIISFLSLTGVVLAITGAEALYADLGHFGRMPITKAWMFIVFPALSLCYMGEGALILHNQTITSNILVQVMPSQFRVAFVILAALATLIASQSVISGTFSLTRQAVKLEFLPKMIVKHTSDIEPGQVYMPFINYLVFILVIALVVGFGSSVGLSNAYGMAVSGTLLADSLLFLVVLKDIWHKSLIKVLLIILLFLPVDILFVSSNLEKVFHGGIFPLLIGIIVFLIIDTWTKGEGIIDKERQKIEGSLKHFVSSLKTIDPSIKRVPGEAVYIGHHPDFAPLALRATVNDLHELPKKVVIVTVVPSLLAHVPEDQRVTIDKFDEHLGIIHLILNYGYHDSINIPKALKNLDSKIPELDFDPNEVAYFISSSKVVISKRHNMASWRKSLFFFMYKNALSRSDYYKLPVKQTEEMQTPIML